MSDSRNPAPVPDTEKMPDDEELEEPSTEKDPGEEPTGTDSTPDDADHAAVGIGVFGEVPPVNEEDDDSSADAADDEAGDEGK